MINSAFYIKNGFFPESLRELARLNKHDDDIVSVKFDKPYLSIIFKTNEGTKKYIFTASGSWQYEQLDIFQNSDLSVSCEELFQNDDGTFVYNLLLRNWGDEVNHIIEFSVTFCQLQIELLIC